MKSPARVSTELRAVASWIDNTGRPSASAASKALRGILASVEGGEAPEVTVESGGTTWTVANPGDHEWTRGLWAFQFGATGTAHVLVWANSVDDGLEEAAEFLERTGKKGYFVPDDVMKQHYEEARAELGPEASEDQVSEKAETDLTYTEAGYIPSHEWWVDEAPPELVSAAKRASSEAFDEPGQLQADEP